jgi:hypothetical protein
MASILPSLANRQTWSNPSPIAPDAFPMRIGRRHRFGDEENVEFMINGFLKQNLPIQHSEKAQSTQISFTETQYELATLI